MNWKQRLFKPKWRHKSADIRLQSVATDQDPELIQSLVDIAGTDEDSRVRCAAIKRLHQLGNILKLYDSEKNAEVRGLLEDRIHQLAASTDESRAPAELRLQVIKLSISRDLIEHLAGHAPEAELRRAALEKVTRQGVLGDCCINDSDAENRKFAASQITQHTTLKRVIDALRKRDKALYSELKARLHRELLDQGDPKAVRTEAISICTGLEKLALNSADWKSQETNSLHTAWQNIASSVPVDLAERYQRVCERMTTPSVTAPKRPADIKTETKAESGSETGATDKPGKALIETPLANETLAQVATDICLYEVENPEHPKPARVRQFKDKLDQAWAMCKPPHEDDKLAWGDACNAIQNLETKLEQQEQQNKRDLEQGQTLLTKLETELEQGELHNALETRANLQKLAKGRGRSKQWQSVTGKMSAMQARLRELRDWQHWSNNKIRKRLIAEMEVLPAADLHPDALLDRIKSLQTEWKMLEKSEQIPGDKHFSAAPWMWRKFSAAGHVAFDTVKPYLDKRSEIQSRHAQSMATFCAELEQMTKLEPMDWNALGKGLNRGRKKLRDLNNIPARQRQKLARQLKAALDRANNVMQDHYRAVESEKKKLIRAATQLIHLPERSEAIAQAKSLQSNWKAAGSLWRSREQELWNQFREHLDPLFEELKEQQASVRAADDERLSAQKHLCAELKDILNSAEDLSALHGRVQGLKDAWKDIEHPDRKLRNRFQELVLQFQQQLEHAEQIQIDSNRDRWWLKSALLHELLVTGRTTKGNLSKRTESRVRKNWPAESSDDEFEIRLDRACENILSGNDIRMPEDELDDLNAQARKLSIGLEFLAGLPSPDEESEQRMKYQVDRLAESMSGESQRQPAEEEARDAEKAWLAMYQLPEDAFKAYGKRIKKALSVIFKG